MKNERECFAEAYKEFVLNREDFARRSKDNRGLRKQYQAMLEIFGLTDESQNKTRSASNDSMPAGVPVQSMDELFRQFDNVMIFHDALKDAEPSSIAVPNYEEAEAALNAIEAREAELDQYQLASLRAARERLNKAKPFTLGELFNHFRPGQAARGLLGILKNLFRSRGSLEVEMDQLRGALVDLKADRPSVNFQIEELKLPWYRLFWNFGEADTINRVARINLRLPLEMKQRTLLHEILHVLHPEWTESQVIATTDHYMDVHNARLAAMPQTVTQSVHAELGVKAKAKTSDLLSIVPRLMAEVHVKPREARSITAALKRSREAVLRAA